MGEELVTRLETALNVTAGEICAELLNLKTSGLGDSERLRTSTEKYTILKEIAREDVDTSKYDKSIESYKIN